MNQLLAIAPFWCDTTQTWVFDDERAGLVQEPFVLGVPEMINRLVADIPDAEKGFRMLFSGKPFPGALKLEKTRDEAEGAWYRSDDFGLEGWVCPAMYHYFPRPAPSEIYVKAEPLRDGAKAEA